jgi:hypothetical protein
LLPSAFSARCSPWCSCAPPAGVFTALIGGALGTPPSFTPRSWHAGLAGLAAPKCYQDREPGYLNCNEEGEGDQQPSVLPVSPNWGRLSGHGKRARLRNLVMNHIVLHQPTTHPLLSPTTTSGNCLSSAVRPRPHEGGVCIAASDRAAWGSNGSPSAAAAKNGEEPEGSLSLFFAFPGQGSNALGLLHSRRLGISKIQMLAEGNNGRLAGERGSRRHETPA